MYECRSGDSGLDADWIMGVGKQRICGRLEGIAAVERIIAREIDSAVHLEYAMVAVASAQDVHTREVDPNRGGGAEREHPCFGRRRHRVATTAEGDVRPPLPRSRPSLDRAHDSAACHQQAQVASAGRDKLLQERTLASKPTPVAKPVQASSERLGILAEENLVSPAPEPGLDDIRWRERTGGIRIAEVRGARLRNPHPPE